MTTPRPVEARLLDRVAEEYQRRGYDVIVEPGTRNVPAALRSLRPDLLAVHGDDHVAVIIKTGNGALGLRSVQDMDALRGEGWRLELVVPDDPVPSAPPAAVAARLGEAEQLADSNHAVAALLLVWTAVDEVLRGLASRFAPSETGRKILSPDQAYSMGLLSEGQHRLLSALQRRRNQAAHSITPEQVPPDVIRDAVNLLIRMSRPSYVPPPIMADRVLAGPDQHGTPLEQVRRLFPSSDPVEQSEAAEYIKSLQAETDH